MLDISNLSFSYAQKRILQDVSFSLKKGEIVALIGPSGSGKTTLFKLITGIIAPIKGSIAIEGKTDFQGQVAHMTQEDLLLPWRTVLSNLMLSFELGTLKSGHSVEKHKLEALGLLDEMGLLGWENAFPRQLSGGMRQRVSLARALLQKKPILLLDEPFGSLDPFLREEMYILIREIQKKFSITVLMVTHDFHDAISLSDRILLLNRGRIQQQWTVDDNFRNNPLTAKQLILEANRYQIKNST